jgi:hypothetical protein
MYPEMSLASPRLASPRLASLRLAHSASRSGRQRRPALLAVLLMGGLLLTAGFDVQGAPRGAVSRSAGAEAEAASRITTPLVSSETKLNLGRTPAGGRALSTFSLTNRTTAPVEVAEIITSCSCLTAELPTHLLAPGQQVQGTLRLDLHREPHFTGNLGIEVNGRNKAAETVFKLTAVVTVEKD